MNRRSFFGSLCKAALGGVLASSVKWLPMPAAPALDTARLEQAFYADLFLFLEQSNDCMTATEIFHRQDELYRKLCP